MSVLGSLIGAGTSILGGILGNNQGKKDRAMQKNAIQIRVADANKAGVNPLYALGAPTFTPSPSPLGSSLADAGQDISRAVDASLDPTEKLDRFQAMAQDLTLKRMGLENMVLAGQVRRVTQAGSPPAAPGGAKPIIDGQGDGRVPLDPDAKSIRLVLPRTDNSQADTFTTSPSSNSQTIADQYGDLAQEAYGLARLGIDAYRNYVKPYADPYIKAAQVTSKKPKWMVPGYRTSTGRR